MNFYLFLFSSSLVIGRKSETVITKVASLPCKTPQQFHFGVTCDVADPVQVAHAFTDIVKRGRPPSVLVNAAGMNTHGINGLIFKIYKGK